ncbi:hypothetical protein [Paenibacillus sp. 1P07SE]|uniref:hypothetical protein n=1 Tax=Paenibacillus sp. 1P07SE TaxID=3132209 RepID=UPI0039A73ADD
MAIRYLCLMLLAAGLILGGCVSDGHSGDERVRISTLEGKLWTAEISDEIKEQGGRRHFTIHYTYKGELERLQQIDRIVFGQGTSLGSQVITLYDEEHRQSKIEEGLIQESDPSEQLAVLVESLGDRESKTFAIDYELFVADNGDTNLDYALTDGTLLIIEWEADGAEFEENLSSIGENT